MSSVAINRMHFPLTTLGYGRRAGVWFQGCSIRCPGCVSRDTWTTTPRHVVALADVLSWLTPRLAEADGLTISGGEPFDQPEALRGLLRTVRACFEGDIIVYTGHAWSRIELEHSWVTVDSDADVVISEPYLAGASASLIWRGSDNQRFHLLTPLGRQRYGEAVNEQPWPEQRSLDVCVGEDEIWMAGIPRPGDLARLQAGLRRRGFSCATSEHTSQPTVCRA